MDPSRLSNHEMEYVGQVAAQKLGYQPPSTWGKLPIRMGGNKDHLNMIMNSADQRELGALNTSLGGAFTSTLTDVFNNARDALQQKGHPLVDKGHHNEMFNLKNFVSSARAPGKREIFRATEPKIPAITPRSRPPSVFR